MRIISRPTPPEPEAILARQPIVDQLLNHHPALRLFNLVLLDAGFDRASLLADLKDLAWCSEGEYKATLGLVVDLAARIAGTGLIGPCELVEYELHHHQAPQMASLRIDISIESASPGYAICQCSIHACGDLDEYRVASAQGTLVKSAHQARAQLAQ